MGFWQRQFSFHRTRPQLIFDVVFGVVAPILCFYFDPFIFKGNSFGFGGGLFPQFDALIYSFAAIEITFLIAVMMAARFPSWFYSFAYGVLAVGSLFCLLIGVALLPFSIIGLFISLIGLPGFTPFLTGIVFFRNLKRAKCLAKSQKHPSGLLAPAVMGMIIALVIPIAVHKDRSRAVRQAIAQLQTDDPQQVTDGLKTLKFYSAILPLNLNEVVWKYQSESDPAKKELLARAYHEVTGGDIEKRLSILD